MDRLLIPVIVIPLPRPLDSALQAFLQSTASDHIISLFIRVFSRAFLFISRLSADNSEECCPYPSHTVHIDVNVLRISGYPCECGPNISWRSGDCQLETKPVGFEPREPSSRKRDDLTLRNVAASEVPTFHSAHQFHHKKIHAYSGFITTTSRTPHSCLVFVLYVLYLRAGW